MSLPGFGLGFQLGLGLLLGEGEDGGEKRRLKLNDRKRGKP